MDLPIIPTQLAAGQGTACYRFASEKDPCNAAMMLVATDTKPRLPPRSWSRITALTAISAWKELTPAGQPDLHVPGLLCNGQTGEHREQPGEVRHHQRHITRHRDSPQRASFRA